MAAIRSSLLALALCACAPTLDWRETRPDGAEVGLLFPCRPQSQSRQVVLSGVAMPMTLSVCDAGGMTWAFAFVDVGDPQRAGPLLDELRRLALAKIGAQAAQTLAFTVRGAAPGAPGLREALEGELPDRRPTRQQIALFARGTKVYQATALGPVLDAEGVETFFDAMRLLP